MLKKFKQIFLKSAKSVGIFRLFGESRWRQNRLLILAYHGISQEDEFLWDSELYVTPEFFRERLTLIKQNGYKVLSLDEAVRRLYEGSLPKRAIAITFDDGNYDFYKEALPVLKDFNFPVTVYQTTYYSGDNKPVFDVALSYLIWKATAGTVLDLFPFLGEKIKITLTGKNRNEPRNLIYNLAHEKNLSADDKHVLLEKLAKVVDVNFQEICRKRLFHLMNPEEISECAKYGIDFQLHTHRHRSPLDEALFRREIEDNRRALNEWVSTSTGHFCYPSGIYNPAFMPWLKNNQIVSATTCDVAMSSPKSDPLLLPRLVDTMYISPIEFEGWLTGISQILPQRKSED